MRSHGSINAPPGPYWFHFGAGRKRGTKEIDLVAKLFDEYGPKYASRNGGYTRIIKIGQRKGDGALQVVLELV